MINKDDPALAKIREAQKNPLDARAQLTPGMAKYNDDQPRDDHGRWEGGGSDSGSSGEHGGTGDHGTGSAGQHEPSGGGEDKSGGGEEKTGDGRTHEQAIDDIRNSKGENAGNDIMQSIANDRAAAGDAAGVGEIGSKMTDEQYERAVAVVKQGIREGATGKTAAKMSEKKLDAQVRSTLSDTRNNADTEDREGNKTGSGDRSARDIARSFAATIATNARLAARNK